MGKSLLANGAVQVSLDAPPPPHELRARKPVAEASPSSQSAATSATEKNFAMANDHGAMNPLDATTEKIETSQTPLADRQTISQPRFSKLTLTKYEKEPLQTRLWLQSRMAENTKIDDYQLGSAPPRRELTWTNLWLAIDLLFILLPAGWAWLTANREVMLRLGIFIFGQALQGGISAVELYFSSQMLGLIDLSIRGTYVSWDEAVRTGTLAVSLYVLPHIITVVFQLNQKVLSAMTTKQATRAVLAMSLSQTVTETHNPVHTGLLQEASAFAGLGGRMFRTSAMPSNVLNALGHVASNMTRLAGQLFMVYSVLTKDGKVFSLANAFVLALALAPSMVRKLVRIWSLNRHIVRMKQRRDRLDLAKRAQTMKSLATSLEYKPESLLYGLEDFILGEYDKATSKDRADDATESMEEQAVEFAHYTMQNVISVVSNVLAVTQNTPGNISLASMNLLSKSFSRSIGGFVQLHSNLSTLINQIFTLTAFNSAYVHFREPKGERVDYEKRRYAEGGMDLELRDVTFTYPGTEEDEPSLRNINLKILAGDTLAIVGANGSGKSTLVKVLLGLYNGHEGLRGDVLVNGQRIGDYDMSTVYARAAVVMQDFKRYNLSLRENVGIGKSSRMYDEAALEQALAKGGAKEVEAQVGLDAKLNATSTSEVGTNRFGPFSDENDSKNKKRRGGKAQTAKKTEKIEEEKGRDESEADPQTKETDDERDDDETDDDATPSTTETSAVSKIARAAVGFLSSFVQDHRAMKRHLLNLERERNKTSTSISGGQWQRVALSRAFLRPNCDVVAFDEPSSNLDPVAEHDLFKTLHHLSESQEDGHRVTTVYVSHRFATVRKARRIIFVENGEIVEDGNHASLMALKGRYYEMWTLQRDGFMDEVSA